MKVAALQLDIAWEDPATNFERIRPWARVAHAAEARLLVLPEMYSYGFSMDTASIEESPEGPSTDFIREQAREHQMWVCGSIPIRFPDHDKPFNTLTLSDPSGKLVRYRKIHPFSFAKEHHHYGAGNDFVTVDIEGLRCTLFVCYDLRFADEFWATAHDTDCYVVVANWPAKRRHHWTVLLQARAIENQTYVIGVNRVGEGGPLTYVGDSQIIDPWGKVLTGAAERETLLLADLDEDGAQTARTKFPILPDRR